MFRQKTHAYFQREDPPIVKVLKEGTMPQPVGHRQREEPQSARLLVNSHSHSKPKPIGRESHMTESRTSHNSVSDRSLSRSGIILVDKGAAKRRTLKDKQLDSLKEQLRVTKLKIKQLEEKEIQNFVLKRENQMFRMELEKIKSQIKVYCQQQEYSHPTSHPHPQPRSSTNLKDDTHLDTYPNKMAQLNGNYKALQQHNLQNLKIIAELKKEISRLKESNLLLKGQLKDQQGLVERMKLLEGLVKRMEADLVDESVQWENQKKAFIEILHAEIESKKE